MLSLVNSLLGVAPSCAERVAAVKPAAARVTLADIEALEAALLATEEQHECPLTHHFAPGVYSREVEMPAGFIVVGNEHLTEHQNVVLSGRARVLVGGEVKTIKAGDVFTSAPHTRKVAIIEETMRFLTIHPNPSGLTDLDQLEPLLFRKSQTLLNYEERRALAASEGGAK